MSDPRRLPHTRTWFEVQYPGINRTVRVSSEEDAQELADAYPGAIAVFCTQGDWTPIGSGVVDARDTLRAYSEWLEDEGAIVSIHLEPRDHDELIADFLASID